jgi:hypothetical protein
VPLIQGSEVLVGAVVAAWPVPGWPKTAPIASAATASAAVAAILFGVM